MKDDISRQGVFDIMDELEMIGKAVSIKLPSCTLINTGDLLGGKSGATRYEIMDAMIAHWMSDPVHGTKTGYSKLAERVLADRAPSRLPTRSPLRENVMPHLRPAAPTYPRELFAEGVGPTLADATVSATTTAPGPTRTSGEDGFPTTSAAEDGEAEATPTTTTRAACSWSTRFFSVCSPFFLFVTDVIIVVKNVYKNLLGPHVIIFYMLWL